MISICRMVGSNEYISFNTMAKQTPYRNSADAKNIIRNVHDFCKREKEDGLKISLNQAKDRASTATGFSKSMIERILKRDKGKEQKPCSFLERCGLSSIHSTWGLYEGLSTPSTLTNRSCRR